MAKISTRNTRALAALLVFVGGWFLFDLVILPFYEEQSALAGEIETSQKLLGSSLRMLQQQDDYEQTLNEIQNLRDTYRSYLLDAGGASSASSQVEEIIRSLAAQNGVGVTRSNPLPDRKIGEEFVKIGVQMNLEGDIPALINFLHAISEYPKFLAVEEFNMATFRVRSQTRIQPRLRVVGFISLS